VRPRHRLAISPINSSSPLAPPVGSSHGPQGPLMCHLHRTLMAASNLPGRCRFPKIAQLLTASGYIGFALGYCSVGIRWRDASHHPHQMPLIVYICCTSPLSPIYAPSPSLHIRMKWQQRARERHAAIKKSCLRSANISQAHRKSPLLSRKRSTFRSPSGERDYSNGSWH
jgi:hypothetical protein